MTDIEFLERNEEKAFFQRTKLEKLVGAQEKGFIQEPEIAIMTLLPLNVGVKSGQLNWKYKIETFLCISIFAFPPLRYISDPLWLLEEDLIWGENFEEDGCLPKENYLDSPRY